MSKRLIAAGLLTVVCLQVLAFVSRPVEAQSAAEWNLLRHPWEHKVVTTEIRHEEKALRDAGQDRWQLIQVVP
jgi:hypothetical protein